MPIGPLEKRSDTVISHKGRRVALLVLAAVVLVVGLIFLGGRVLGCLGPLNVTEVQCIAAYNATYDADYSPGPVGEAWIVAAIALFLAAGAIVPWRALSLRSLASVAGFGVIGAVLGAVVYTLTRPTSLSGPTSTGAVITVTFPANIAAQLLDVVIGAGVAVLIAGLVLAAGASRQATAHRPNSR